VRHPRPDYIPEGHLYVPIEFAAEHTHRRLNRQVRAVLALMIMLALAVGAIVHAASVDGDPPAPAPSTNPVRPPPPDGHR
jgi:hypothetical protein